MTIMSRRALVAISTMVLAAIAAPTRADVYSFTSFDGIGDHAGGTTVNALNNNGSLVGFSANANATALTNFVRNPDGTFTTVGISGSPTAMANGINDNNQIVGGVGTNAFLLTNNYATQTFVPPANPGNTTSEVAFGINKGGTIVGQYVDAVTGNTPGFIYANGNFTILNPTATATVTNVQSINNNGLAIGFYSADGVHQHGFLYDTKTATTTLIADPNVANIVLTQFLGVNDNNKAVGYYQFADGSQHSFLYSLDTKTYSFLDDPNAAKSGVSITQITGINDANQIAGFYVDATTGLQRGFIALAVPEPNPLTLAGVGLTAAFVCASLRKRAVAMPS